MSTEHLQCARHLARCWAHRSSRTLQFSRRQQTNKEMQGNVNRSIWTKLEARGVGGADYQSYLYQ